MLGLYNAVCWGLYNAVCWGLYNAVCWGYVMLCVGGYVMMCVGGCIMLCVGGCIMLCVWGCIMQGYHLNTIDTSLYLAITEIPIIVFHPDDREPEETPWECDDTGSDLGCFVFRGPERRGYDALSWDDAQSDCKTIGGQLAVAKSAQEVEDLAAFIRKLFLNWCVNIGKSSFHFRHGGQIIPSPQTT